MEAIPVTAVGLVTAADGLGRALGVVARHLVATVEDRRTAEDPRTAAADHTVAAAIANDILSASCR